MPLVDVVVVAYNSGDELRGCVGPLVGDDEISVVVVDNASPEGGLESLDGLPAIRIPLDYNGGFAHGCNVGIRAGSAPYVLLLNPDTVIQPASVRQLADELAATPELGAVAPRIVYPSGELHLSQRRFPGLRSTFAQALYLNQIFPRATWASELVRTPADYERRTAPEWVSGACILFPRDLLEALGGLDEGFFLYCEDTDICRRVWDSGRSIRFVPDAEVVHVGGASAPERRCSGCWPPAGSATRRSIAGAWSQNSSASASPSTPSPMPPSVEEEGRLGPAISAPCAARSSTVPPRPLTAGTAPPRTSPSRTAIASPRRPL